MSEKHLDEAEACFSESLALWRGLGDRKYAQALNCLGWTAIRRGDPARARACFETALPVQEELGDWWVIPATLQGLGVAAAQVGDHTRARALIVEGTRRIQKMGRRDMLASLIEVLADLHAAKEAQGQAGHDPAAGLLRAARLYGAAAAHDPNLAQSPEAPVPDRKRETVRAWLGEEAFAAAFAEGRAMTLEQAVEYALELEPPS
jgi:tetratricopeptide (TPR) repeat protein